MKNENQAEKIAEKIARTPKGAGVHFMRKLANIGFAIAAAYFCYLVVLLCLAYKRNSEMAGSSLGDHNISVIQEVSPGTFQGLAQSESKKILVMWATWCGPCHALLLSLKSEYEAGKLDAKSVVAISMVEPESDVRAYLEKTPLPFNVGLDEKGDLARRLKVSGTPTVVHLNPNGQIASVSTGGLWLTTKALGFLNGE